MTFIEPKATLVATNIPQYSEHRGLIIEKVHDTIGFLANCARTCYQSYEKSTYESDLKLVKHLIKSGHHSVLEHLTVTMRLVTSRMVTHELVRHRLASYSERSTRYCDSNDLHIVPPVWVQKKCELYELKHKELLQETPISKEIIVYRSILEEIEIAYNNLLEQGCTKENASSILPNDTATEIVVTANAREWRHIFKMRLDKAARPEMRQIMELAKAEMLKINDMNIVLGDGE